MFMNPIPIQLSLFSMSENKLESIYLKKIPRSKDEGGGGWQKREAGCSREEGKERIATSAPTDPLLMLLPLLPSFRHIPLTDQGEGG